MGDKGRYSMRPYVPMDENGCTTDPLGNKFRTISSMCRAWGVPRETLRSRLLKGMTLTEALEGKAPEGTPGECGDAICICGEWFGSLKHVSARYGICEATLIDHEGDLEGYITSITKNQADGTVYRTKSSRAMGSNMQPNLFRKRIAGGMAEEEALAMEKMKKGHGRPCTDHKGNPFNTETAMCSHYRIPLDVYLKRISRRWTKERALTTPVRGWLPPVKAEK